MTPDGCSCSGPHMRPRSGPTGSTSETYLTARGHVPGMILGLLAPAQPPGSGAATGEGRRTS